MMDIIIFELKKIIRRKTTIYTMIGVLLFILITFTLPAFQYKGLEAIKVSKKLSKNTNSKLTEENITKDLKNFQKYVKIQNDGEWSFKGNAYWEFFMPRQHYFGLIVNNYAEPFVYLSVEKLNKLKLDNGAEFYEKRKEKLHSILNNNPYSNHSNAEKTFWLEKNKKIKTPYDYGYALGWRNILDRLPIFIFVILGICISIAPVFASEYESGADAIILSSRYGKSKVIRAKILASYIFAILTSIIIAILGIGSQLLLFGTEGWNLPIQIVDTIISYPFNFLQLVLYMLLITFVVMLSLVSITLFLSSKMKSSFSVLIVNIVIIILPLFLGKSDTGDLYNHIYYLLPGVSLQNLYSQYISYSFGNIVLDIYTMTLVAYIIMLSIFLPLSMRTFKNHQIN